VQAASSTIIIKHIDVNCKRQIPYDTLWYTEFVELRYSEKFRLYMLHIEIGTAKVIKCVTSSRHSGLWLWLSVQNVKYQYIVARRRAGDVGCAFHCLYSLNSFDEG